MTGIDLFKALNGVKEEYIAEADTDRKLPRVRFRAWREKSAERCPCSSR